MKTLFKVWNVLIIVFWGIIGALLTLSLIGIGEVSTALSGRYMVAGGIASIAIFLALVIVLANVVMGVAGFRGKIDKATKIAYVILALDIISLVISDNKASALLQIVIMIGYIVMAKKTDKYAIY